MTSRKEELEQLIAHHKQLYYRGHATISDAAYDSLEDELRTLDAESYVLSKVGYEVEGDKIPHDRPMLSLEKSRQVAEVVDWMDGDSCVVSDKMDGSSASLIYRSGVFHLAKTRGNGTVGENLTPYFRHIRVPKILLGPVLREKDVEIRGELCISRDDFGALDVEMRQRGLEPPKSIRNIVAGLLHRKDNQDLCTYLTFFGYEILSDTVSIATEMDKFDCLKDAGFVAPHYALCAGQADFESEVSGYEVRLATSPFLTDGLVLAVNDVAAQLARGFTAHHPKGKHAFKFKSDCAVTAVRDIIVDVGRTGRITFVGVVDPVYLSEARVSRVTLNNVKYIKEHQINVGCEIEITRSGEVIPKHEKTVKVNGAYEFPTHCPVCKELLVVSDTAVDLVCTNIECGARREGRIQNWLRVTGVDSIGPETLRRLMESGLVTDIASLYDLQADAVAALEGLGERSAEIILKNIASSRTMLFSTFLAALGITGMGPSVARLIAGRFPDPASLQSASCADLVAIDGIGDVLADNVETELSAYGWPLRDALLARGVQLEGDAPTATDGFVSGKTFVITGALSRPRAQIKKDIENCGGRVTGTVSKNTDYLLCNEASSSSKYKKAQSLGLKIITEDELGAMVNRGE